MRLIFYEAVAIVCCGVTGGVCGSCFFSATVGFIEPFQEEFVGVVGARVEEFCGEFVEIFFFLLLMIHH